MSRLTGKVPTGPLHAGVATEAAWHNGNNFEKEEIKKKKEKKREE
jgi:hypothetical protein